MAISVRAGSAGDRERIIVTRSDGNYEIERTKFKINPMMSAGDLEDSIFFLHEGVISFCSSVNHIYLAHAPCSRTGSMRLISRVYATTSIHQLGDMISHGDNCMTL